MAKATTTYKVTGTRKAVNDQWSTLPKMEVNSKNIWLYQVAEHYGIDYETKQISIRGHIYWAECEEDPNNDYYLLSFETKTAWECSANYYSHGKNTLTASLLMTMPLNGLFSLPTAKKFLLI